MKHRPHRPTEALAPTSLSAFRPRRTTTALVLAVRPRRSPAAHPATCVRKTLPAAHEPPAEAPCFNSQILGVHTWTTTNQSAIAGVTSPDSCGGSPLPKPSDLWFLPRQTGSAGETTFLGSTDA
eukprot:720419-Prymnesium_polylepis.2